MAETRKGAARRAARKRARASKKREKQRTKTIKKREKSTRKTARQESRQEKRSDRRARKGGRQESRQDKRAAKQERKSTRQSERQARKAQKQTARQERKGTRAGRVSERIAAKSEAGWYSPEAVASRQQTLQTGISTYGDIATTGLETAGELLEAVYAPASGIAEGLLGGLDLESVSDFWSDDEDEYDDEETAISATDVETWPTWAWVALAAGGAGVVYLATRKR